MTITLTLAQQDVLHRLILQAIDLVEDGITIQVDEESVPAISLELNELQELLSIINK